VTYPPKYEHDSSGMYEVPNGEWLRLSEVVELLEEFIENTDLPEVVDRLEWLKDSIKGEK
jgi:hypothetical protein